MNKSYVRFVAMIAVSTVIMYALMYLNVSELSHAEFSQTRLWMAVIMGATMAIVMLTFMRAMYPSKTANIAILGAALGAFVIALWLVRSQRTVDDVSYMKAMIPHHSIAVLTSTRARIRDPRVRELADGIIRAQVREIAQMQQLIESLERSPTLNGAPLLPPAMIGSETQAK